MQQTIHHQSVNTHLQILTTYRYDHTSNPGPIGIPHFHKNYEILIPTVGVTQVTVDGQSYAIKPGQAIMIHPFQIHHLHLSQSAWIWCSVFSAQLVSGLHADLEGKKPRTPVFTPHESTTRFFLEEMLRHFYPFRGYSTLTMQQTMAAKACLYAMGCDYVAQAELIADGDARKTENLAVRVAHYIETHFQSEITLRDVARELGYSYQYLSNTFHSLFGINFKKLLNQYRMDHAIRLLQETTLPITQVAFESGFQSLRTFNHVCSELFQRTPTDIRNDRKRSPATVAAL